MGRPLGSRALRACAPLMGCARTHRCPFSPAAHAEPSLSCQNGCPLVLWSPGSLGFDNFLFPTRLPFRMEGLRGKLCSCSWLMGIICPPRAGGQEGWVPPGGRCMDGCCLGNSRPPSLFQVPGRRPGLHHVVEFNTENPSVAQAPGLRVEFRS